MDLAALIDPVPEERFLNQHYDLSPLHIPADGAAGGQRRELLPWARLNALLGVGAVWREDNVKLILNGVPVPPDQYLEAAMGPIRYADAARMQVLLGTGASLVADGIEYGSPELKQVTAMLSNRFLGTSTANLYCSFRGVQAFRTHCDLHDVFAIHTEGEKVWRIYEKREVDPVAHYDASVIEQRRGGVLTEVRMRPGDLLYIPRGFYHDALASSEASLHVTFSVARLHGRVLFRLLEELAMEDAAFRAYLPDGRVEDGQELGKRLDTLAERIAALIRTPLFALALRNRQLALAQSVAEPSLPERPTMRFFTRTRAEARIVRHETGPILIWSGGQSPLGLLAEAAEWFLSQNVVLFEALLARFPQHEAAALADLVALFQRARLVESAVLART